MLFISASIWRYAARGRRVARQLSPTPPPNRGRRRLSIWRSRSPRRSRRSSPQTPSALLRSYRPPRTPSSLLRSSPRAPSALLQSSHRAPSPYSSPSTPRRGIRLLPIGEFHIEGTAATTRDGPRSALIREKKEMKGKEMNEVRWDKTLMNALTIRHRKTVFFNSTTSKLLWGQRFRFFANNASQFYVELRGGGC